MKTILAPTDFSRSSINAVNYAADLALSIKADLVLFHAIPFPIAVSEISVPGDFIDDMMDAAQRDMDDLCEKIKIRTKDKISVATDIKIGAVEQEIDNISSKEKPLAIVMGIRSGRNLERALMGSSIFHIMNHVSYPTIIVPENIQFNEIKNIGMACDLKRVDKKIPFETITEWLSLFKANLEIINIEIRDKDFKADQSVESVSLQNRLQAFRPHFNFLTGSNIAEELNEFVNIHPLDLLIVLPGKHGIFSLFRKKKSKFIINHSHLPILSIHKSKVGIA
jgi:nucleotide-binding universal stress UspA family protein